MKEFLMKPLLCLLALLPASAHAAIQCQYHDAAVAEATTVVQIIQPQITYSEEPGYCVITGIVQRSFRGDRTISEKLNTTTPCEANVFPPGPQIVTDYAALAAAQVIELHITDHQVASDGAGLAILPELTDAPARPPLCGE
jgi:hypothetical protein